MEGKDLTEALKELKEVRFGKIRVKIKGITPLLMNKFVEDKEPFRSRRKPTKEELFEEAKKHAYINEKGELYIPASAVAHCILNRAKELKAGGKNLASYLKGTFFIEPNEIPLGKKDFEVDVRRAVIQRNAILKARAKVFPWEAEFYIIYDKATFPIPLDEIPKLRFLIDQAGYKFGLLDYRPEKGGEFGRFEVVEFEVIE